MKVESDRSNFLSETTKLKTEMCVSSFSDLSIDHFNFLLNYNFNTKANDYLVGHIKDQYIYDYWPKDFENYLINKVLNDDALMNQAKQLNLVDENSSLFLSGLWINKQKKYEFNPIHLHVGVFSFIIPLQIPYDLNEEDKNLQGGRDNVPSASRLTFLKSRNNPLDQIHQFVVNMDKSYVGKVLMFSSTLNHMVYPFYTSDEYRITVSGNITKKEYHESTTSRMA